MSEKRLMTPRQAVCGQLMVRHLQLSLRISQLPCDERCVWWALLSILQCPVDAVQGIQSAKTCLMTETSPSGRGDVDRAHNQTQANPPSPKGCESPCTKKGEASGSAVTAQVGNLQRSELWWLSGRLLEYPERLPVMQWFQAVKRAQTLNVNNSTDSNTYTSIHVWSDTSTGTI